MCLLSLLEEKGASMEDKNIGIFSYGSGCGAEFLIAHVGRGLKQQLKNINFKKQLARRKQISMDEYSDLYGDAGESKNIKQENGINNADEFSRFVFTGIKDHKRQYVKR